MESQAKRCFLMGSEIGQWQEWDHDQSLEWHLLQYENHKKIRDYVGSLTGYIIRTCHA
jgi:1,4-alpha-glucan branching enzyme